MSVINDVNEGGVRFSREHYEVRVREDSQPGEALAALRGEVVAEVTETDPSSAEPRLLYGLHAAHRVDDSRLFRLGETSGVLELAAPLDREVASVHELTVWVRDQTPRAARAFARVTVRVHDADDHSPDWGRRLAVAHVSADAAPGEYDRIVLALTRSPRRAPLSDRSPLSPQALSSRNCARRIATSASMRASRTR